MELFILLPILVTLYLIGMPIYLLVRQRRHEQRLDYFIRKLDRAIEDARANGVRSVDLEVRRSNDGARRLYLGAGFSIVGVRRGYYSRPREDAIHLRRDLIGEDDAS